jgi:hypothetical protein
MLGLTTHYDSLKVTRDAPPEVIRAAYQALASKYHPDRNPNNAEAERLMKLVNAAYEALGDPAKREQHDRWIQSMEMMAQQAALVHHAQRGRRPDDAPSVPYAPRDNPGARSKRAPLWVFTGVTLALLAGVAAWLVPMLFEDHSISARSLSSAAAAREGAGERIAERVAVAPAPANMPTYVRPSRAPSGEAWPTESGYIPGFKVLFNDGQSTVTLDNSANSSDVYLKLYAYRDARSFTVRWVYVKGGDAFTVRDLRPGRYEIRYRDLDNGIVTRSEPFELRENTVAEGTRITAVRIPLVKATQRDRVAGSFDLDF